MTRQIAAKNLKGTMRGVRKTQKFFKMAYLKLEPRNFFVTCSLIFGLLFVLITPPFQAPDEPLHFYRAYQISTLNFVPDPITNITETRYGWGTNSLYGGGVMPDALGRTVEITLKPRPERVTRLDRYNVAEAMRLKIDSDKRQSYETTSAIFTPLMYAPQALTIFIARIFNTSPIAMMYLARFSVLIVWTVLYSYAIKYTPRKKWLMTYAGLIPMALFQASSLGGDGITISSCALFIALIFYLNFENKKITKKQLALLIIVGCVLALSKGIMSVFLLLMLILSYKSLDEIRWRGYVKKGLIILPPLFLLSMWTFLTRGVNTSTIALAPGYPDTKLQTAALADNPLHFISVLWNTYLSSASDRILNSFMGMFGTLDAKLPMTLIIVAFVGLVLLLWGQEKRDMKPWLMQRPKWVILATCIAYFVGVNLAMYLAATPIGSSRITGIQGRYFLPLILPISALLYRNDILISKNIYKTVAVILPVILLTASIIVIWQSYYVFHPILH